LRSVVNMVVTLFFVGAVFLIEKKKRVYHKV
jgi:hypothetical protein